MIEYFLTNKKARFWAEFTVIAVLVATGFFVRSWNLGEQSLWIDEGFTINGATSVIDRGVPILDSGKFYKNGILASYIVAGMMKLLPFDPFSPGPERLPAVFFGAALVLLAYFLTKDIFKNKYLAFFVAFITTFSYWEIAWSRQVRGYTMASFFLVLSVFLIWKYLQSQKINYLYLALPAFLFAYLSHESSLAFILAIGVFILLEQLSRRKQSTELTTFIRYGGLITTCTFIFFIIALIFLDYSSVKTLSFFTGTPVYLELAYWGAICAYILSFFDRKNSRGISFLFNVAFITTSAILILSPTAQLRYFFPVYVILIILCVYSIYRISEIFLKKYDYILTPILSFVLLFCITFSYLQFTPTTFYRLEHGSPQPDFKSAFKLIKKEYNFGDIIISGYTALNKLYLNEKGMWLMMHFNGKWGNEQSSIINGLDYYTAAPVIEDIDSLTKTIETQHGFIVIDTMTKFRLPSIYKFIVESHKIKRVFTSDDSKFKDEVEVFRF